MGRTVALTPVLALALALSLVAVRASSAGPLEAVVAPTAAHTTVRYRLTREPVVVVERTTDGTPLNRSAYG
jgi:hypothetical protein